MRGGLHGNSNAKPRLGSVVRDPGHHDADDFNAAGLVVKREVGQIHRTSGGEVVIHNPRYKTVVVDLHPEFTAETQVTGVLHTGTGKTGTGGSRLIRTNNTK